MNYIIVFILLLLYVNTSYQSEIDLSDYKSTSLNTLTLNSFISSSKPTIVYYYTNNKDAQKFLNIFLKAADQYLEDNDEIAFGVLDIDKELRVRSTYSIESPSVIYYSKGKELAEFQGAKNKKSLEKFIENPLLIPSPSNGPASWGNIESQVAHLSNRNYSSFITNNKDVLTMYYTPQCGHCTRAKPAYSEASTSIIKKNIGRLAAVDCSQNKKLCDQLDIQSYPTFYYFKNGQKFDIYKGGRSKENFIDYLNEKSKLKDSATPTITINNNNNNNNNNNKKSNKKEL